MKLLCAYDLEGSSGDDIFLQVFYNMYECSTWQMALAQGLSIIEADIPKINVEIVLFVLFLPLYFKPRKLIFWPNPFHPTIGRW